MQTRPQAHILIAIAILFCGACASSKAQAPADRTTPKTQKAPKVIVLQAEGNLQAFEPVGCVDVASLSSTNTPADVYPGAAACLRQGDLERASGLVFAARMLGHFDMQRVSDGSAHQAVFALEEGTFYELREEQLSEMNRHLVELSDSSSAKHHTFCATLKQIGPPSYRPVYMIQHGLGAFGGNAGTGLVPGFNPSETWKRTLNGAGCK